MSRASGNVAHPKSANRRLGCAAAISLVGVFVSSLAASQAGRRGGHRRRRFCTAVCRRAEVPEVRAYRDPAGGSQTNRPLGMRSADRLARELGLNKRDVFTTQQYGLLVSGKGNGGDQADARLVRASIRILTNTTGSPEFVRVNGKLTPVVLGSYGLTVNRAGKLESVANENAPTRKINTVIAPRGVLPQVVPSQRRQGIAADAVPVGLHL